MDQYLQRLHDAVHAATQGMTIDDLKRHTEEGKWCAAEVLEHLYLTYAGTEKGFQRCLAAGKPMATSPTLKQRVRTVAVTGLGYFPGGRKSPGPVTPRGAPAEKVVAEICPQIVAMDKAIADCEARYGGGKLLDHPVLGPLTAKQWRKFHLLHGEHHVRQIWRLRQGS